MGWSRSGHIGQFTFVAVLLSILLVWSPQALADHQNDQGLILATYPFGDAKRIHSAFTPLAMYLEQRLETPIRLVVTRDYGELADRLNNGTIDLAWIGSANYVNTLEDPVPPTYIATYRERSKESGELQAFYRAAIITLQSAPYQTLEALKGTRFGFTDPDSTSGHAYPRMMLAQQQIVPEDFFSETYFLGTHLGVVEALLAGSIHAGAVSDGTYYNAVAEHPGTFRVLTWSDPIPLDAFVAAPSLSEKRVEQVRQALLSIGADDHPVNRSIRDHLNWPAAGFEQRSADFYRPLLEALAGVRLRAAH
ncbi:MAG: phosphate/phosphite/phosphonate ABC transporter substrate-binding protein [Oceanospirillaceae bacterium]|jgi:phosphonate transport system substrate-binding protein|uniref:phosphate/phosphite/phosphonate ABC transporter substrate-binding protein n=1 Tax=Marinobacterium litorale TaxID=404770 RepID=UPI0004846C0D|nr:phosphate/phosphite/phosphonate ABC transporter substrate-binding protein [Marinobacterium litorale]MBS98942.1 phosphate/phosphite/phosphonate ABC transporter substrate-binding protein [Oceanospirillaceae bacterium]